MRRDQWSPPSSLQKMPREVPAYIRAGAEGSNASAVATMLSSPVLEPAQFAAPLSLRKTPPGFSVLGLIGKFSSAVVEPVIYGFDAASTAMRKPALSPPPPR